MKLVSSIAIGDIYLFFTPPKKRLDKDMQKTLFELDSVPMGTFYMGTNSEWYIAHEYGKIIQKWLMTVSKESFSKSKGPYDREGIKKLLDMHTNILWKSVIVQYSLIRLKDSGSLTAYIILYRYLMCRVKFYTLELNMC